MLSTGVRAAAYIWYTWYKLYIRAIDGSYPYTPEKGRGGQDPAVDLQNTFILSWLAVLWELRVDRPSTITSSEMMLWYYYFTLYLVHCRDILLYIPGSLLTV